MIFPFSLVSGNKSESVEMLHQAEIDTLAYKDRLYKEYEVELDSSEYLSILAFAQGLYTKIGKTDFVTLRSGQNVGTGSAFETFHGKVGALVDGAVWTTSGVSTDKNNQSFAELENAGLGNNYSLFVVRCGDPSNGIATPINPLTVSRDRRQYYAFNVLLNNNIVEKFGYTATDYGKEEVYIKAHSSDPNNLLNLYTSFSPHAVHLKQVDSTFSIKAWQYPSTINSESKEAPDAQGLQGNYLYLGVRWNWGGVYNLGFTGTHSFVLLAKDKDILDMESLNYIYSLYKNTIGKGLTFYI